MKNKYFYPIFKLKAKSWIRYWLLKKTEFKGKLSEILTGFSFNLENTLNRKFKIFEILGNSVQDGEPSPENEVPILNAGDNGSITEKIVNKNLWGGFSLRFNASGIEAIQNEDGSMNINGTATATINTLTSSQAKPYLKTLPAGVYTISANVNTPRIELCTSTGTELTRITNAQPSKTIILNSETQIFVRATVISGTTVNNETIYIQIELGSTATPYVPHKEQTYTIPTQQPMRSIGDVRDVFFKNVKDSKYYNKDLEENKWYERHYMASVTLNGSEETWEYSSTAQGSLFRNTNVIKSIEYSIPKSNYFRGISSATGRKNGDFYFNYGAQANHKTFDFMMNDFNNLEDFKTWLSRHNVEVQGKLATPLDLPCTEEQIEILENPPKTFAGQTNINSPDEVKPFLKIQYWESDTNG